MPAVLRAYLLMGLMNHETARQVLEPIAKHLRTGEPDDSVDRLFESKHVNDLRLIAAVCCILGLWMLVTAIVVAIFASSLQWWEHEDKLLSWRVVHSISAGGSDFLLLVGPTLAVFGAVLAWAYQVGAARLGVVDLFACEIGTLCRVSTIVDVVARQTERFLGGPASDAPIASHAKPALDQFTSEENYFPILDSNARDLQSLEARVVINITAFYTYMKTVRDSFRALAGIKPSAQEMKGPDGGSRPWHEGLRNAIYMLYLALESGRRAISDLVEFQPDRAERIIVILISELTAYRFLREQYADPADVHFERLILRGPEYVALMGQLRALMQIHEPAMWAAVYQGTMQHGGSEACRWLPAYQLMPELERRYASLSTFQLDCIELTKDKVLARRGSPNTSAEAALAATAGILS
jgi:hypothetical protein